MAICVAPLIILGSCFLLGWNERRAVCSDRAISAGENTVTEIGCTNVNEATGSLVMLACDIQKAGLPSFSPGGDFGGSFQFTGVGLRSDAEMLQCVETEHDETHKDKGGGGGTTTIKTYTYSTEWKSEYVNSRNFNSKGRSSSNFARNCGHDNPNWPGGLPRSGPQYAKSMKLGDGGFTTSLTSSVPLDTPLFGDKTPPHGWQLAGSQFESITWETDRNTGIGRVRASFYGNDWTHPEATLLGQNNNGNVVPWTAPDSWLCSGFELNKLKMGSLTRAQLFQSLRDENTTITWVVRIVGCGLLWMAFAMMFGPLEVAADCIPCVGPYLGDSISSITCCISCFPGIGCCLGVAGVVWVAMRPLIGIPLMLAWLLILGGFIGFIVKKRAEKRQVRDIEAPGMGMGMNAPLAAGGVPYAAQAAQPTPQALPMAQAVPAQPAPRQMQVQVPAGYGPGMALQVNTPSGPVQVTIPEGFGPGTTFMFSY